MNLVVIVASFPKNKNDYKGRFVLNLIENLLKEKKGINISVINPYPITKGVLKAEKEVMYYDSQKINIYRHPYIPFHNRLFRLFFSKKTIFKKSSLSFAKACMHIIRKNNIQPNHIYSHFSFPSGTAGMHVSKELGCIQTIYSSESKLISNKYLHEEFSNQKNVNFISANSERKQELDKLGIKKNIVLPNGVDTKKFYRIDRSLCRKRLNLPKDEFIVCFVGAFIDRKGFKKFNAAIKDLNLRAIYIGSGKDNPPKEHSLYAGKVQHDELKYYLCAADIFVLPTKAEGSCNAVLEALACGCPIITSNRIYMNDIVNDDVSLRVDPDNVMAIKKAILHLKNNPIERERLSRNALNWIKKFEIKKRTRKILDIINC